MTVRTRRFQPEDRLRDSREFQRVSQRGRRAAGTGFVLVAADPPRAAERAPHPRLGITVSRKVGSAVVRNHVKRRIREWFRAQRGSLGPAVDLVVIGRSAAAGMSTAAIQHELSRLAEEVAHPGSPRGGA